MFSVCLSVLSYNRMNLLTEITASLSSVFLHELQEDCRWAAVRWSLLWKFTVGSKKWTQTTSFSSGNVSEGKKKRKKKKKNCSSWKERKNLLPSTSEGQDCWLLFSYCLTLACGLLNVLVLDMLLIFLCNSCSKSYYEIPHVLYATYWQVVRLSLFREGQLLRSYRPLLLDNQVLYLIGTLNLTEPQFPTL